MGSAVHIVFGATVGFALGILGPIAVFFLMSWLDPTSMKHGGATPLAILTILTAPGGAIAGAIWGATAFHSPGEIIKKGSHAEIGKFEQQFGGFSVEEQRAALTEILPQWFDEYRKSMFIRIWVTIAFFVLSAMPVMLIFLFAYTYRTAQIVLDMRSGIRTIRARWGDEVIDQLGPLPYSLRAFSL